MNLPHKDIVFPEVDLSGDEGDPRWKGEEWPREPGEYHHTWIRPPGTYARSWEYKQEWWAECVTAYEEEPANFLASWRYLNNHPVYWRFHPSSSEFPANHVSHLETEYGFGSNAIDVQVAQGEDGIRVELETGKWALHIAEGEKQHNHWHDYELDCYDPTYEEAVVRLARMVWDRYGNDRRIADAP